MKLLHSATLAVLTMWHIAANAQTVTFSREDSLQEKWTIDRPEVRVSKTVYYQIIVRGGDIVSFLAEGCVNTGGVGKTAKHFVFPKGPNSDHLYFGTVFVPGINNNQFQRFPQAAQDFAVPVGQEGAIGIGYVDDDYDDNKYEGLDEGSDGHCSGKGPVKVFVTIRRHERLCRYYAYLVAAQNKLREECGKSVPPDLHYHWHPDFRVHYQWCLWVGSASLPWDEYDARTKWLQDQACGMPSKYGQLTDCAKYTLKALGQNWLRERCGKPVPPDQGKRWNNDAALHYDWCSQVPTSVEVEEEDARTDYLNREFCIAAPLPIK